MGPVSIFSYYACLTGLRVLHKEISLGTVCIRKLTTSFLKMMVKRALKTMPFLVHKWLLRNELSLLASKNITHVLEFRAKTLTQVTYQVMYGALSRYATPQVWRSIIDCD